MKQRYWRNCLLVLLSMVLGPVSVGSCADLSLDQAVQMALQQNTTLKITQKGEDTAAAALHLARGKQGVTLTAGGSATTAKVDSSAVNKDLSVKLTAAFPLYSGGKTDAEIKSAEIGVDSAKLLTQRECENIKFNVITAYYDVLQAKKTVNVDQESVDNYQAHLENVQQLYSAGSKARVDVLRSSVALSNARQTLIKAQNAYEIGAANLRNILNMHRDEMINLTDDVVYQPFADTLEHCIDCAAQNRKDIKVSAYTLEQKELAIKMAAAGYKPTVDLSLGTSLSDQLQPLSSHSHAFTAGVNVSWNIFDSGVTRATVDTARAERDIASLTLDKDREDVDFNVRQSYYNMREAEKRIQSSEDAVNQAKEDYMIAREKYRAGEGVMLDIVDAQLALSTAELNDISAQYDYARYKASLENAMGI